jgi:hypothetical protein
VVAVFRATPPQNYCFAELLSIQQVPPEVGEIFKCTRVTNMQWVGSIPGNNPGHNHVIGIQAGTIMEFDTLA